MTIGVPFQNKRLMEIGDAVGDDDAAKKSDVDGVQTDLDAVESFLTGGYTPVEYGWVTNDTKDQITSTTYTDLSGMAITKTIVSGDIIILFASWTFSVDWSGGGALTDKGGWRFVEPGAATIFTTIEQMGSTNSIHGENSGASLNYIGTAGSTGSLTFKMQHARASGASGTDIYTKYKRMGFFVLRAYS